MDLKVRHDTVVVFDLDDTLYNELDYLKSAYQSIALHLEAQNWKPLYSKMFALYRSNVNVFEFLADSCGVQTIELIELYRNHKPKIELFEGVLELFEAIKSKNAKIGIITDGRAITQRAKLESLNVLKYIDKIIISEEIGSEKPSMANFKAIETSLPGKEYYFVADNLKKDFIAPNMLGWKTVALIDNGMNIHFESHNYMTDEYQPNEYVLSLKEINIT